MTDETLGIIIGGIAPAVILGFFIVFQKLATRNGAGPGEFLLILGVVSAIIGGVLHFTGGTSQFTLSGTAWTVLSSGCWALSMGGVAYALFKYHIPVSKLNPIFNTNTLTAVILGILFLGEWSQINAINVFIGAILIISGAIIVSRA